MKFLILVDQRVGAPPLPDPIAAYEAASAYLEAMLADGRLDCVYNFADGRRAMGIANADSAAELWDALVEYPLSLVQTYEVHPLVGVDHTLATGIARMKEMAGG
jgi:hypothetical protein